MYPRSPHDFVANHSQSSPHPVKISSPSPPIFPKSEAKNPPKSTKPNIPVPKPNTPSVLASTFSPVIFLYFAHFFRHLFHVLFRRTKPPYPLTFKEILKNRLLFNKFQQKQFFSINFSHFLLRFQKLYVFLQSALSSLAPLWKVNVFTASLLTRQSTPSRERRCHPYRGGHLGGKIESHDILKRRLRASCL